MGWGRGQRAGDEPTSSAKPPLQCYTHNLKGKNHGLCVLHSEGTRRQPGVLRSWDQITTGTWEEQSRGADLPQPWDQTQRELLRMQLPTPSHPPSNPPPPTNCEINRLSPRAPLHASLLQASCTELRVQAPGSRLRLRDQGSGFRLSLPD